MTRHEDHAAEFAGFVRQEGPRLLRLAVVVAGPSAAEDLLQDALAGAFARWSHVRTRDPVAYVCRSVVNGRTSAWRRSRREQPLLEHDDIAVPDDAFSQHDDRQRLLQALQQLPRQRRAVLTLRYLQDWDDAAIAHALGVRRATVRSAAQRGLAQLRELLDTPESRRVTLRHKGADHE